MRENFEPGQWIIYWVLSSSSTVLVYSTKYIILCMKLNHWEEIGLIKLIRKTTTPNILSGAWRLGTIWICSEMSQYNTIQYNTTQLSLCREICLLARHLCKTFNTFDHKNQQLNKTEQKTTQIQSKIFNNNNVCTHIYILLLVHQTLKLKH